MTSSALSDLPFAPAVVVPEQAHTPRGFCQPERRLLLAMLEDALTTALRIEPTNGRRRVSPRAQARSWILSEDVRWPYSFVNVCAFLGFDPVYLRRSVMIGETPGHVRSGARRLSGSRTRVSPSRHAASRA